VFEDNFEKRKQFIAAYRSEWGLPAIDSDMERNDWNLFIDKIPGAKIKEFILLASAEWKFDHKNPRLSFLRRIYNKVRSKLGAFTEFQSREKCALCDGEGYVRFLGIKLDRGLELISLETGFDTKGRRVEEFCIECTCSAGKYREEQKGTEGRRREPDRKLQEDAKMWSVLARRKAQDFPKIDYWRYLILLKQSLNGIANKWPKRGEEYEETSEEATVCGVPVPVRRPRWMGEGVLPPQTAPGRQGGGARHQEGSPAVVPEETAKEDTKAPTTEDFS